MASQTTSNNILMLYWIVHILTLPLNKPSLHADPSNLLVHKEEGDEYCYMVNVQKIWSGMHQYLLHYLLGKDGTFLFILLQEDGQRGSLERPILKMVQERKARLDQI